MLFQKGAVGYQHWLQDLAVLIWLISIMSSAHAAVGPQFSAIRLWPSTLYTRLTFESATLPHYRYFILKSPRGW
ncbi:hypothetical protein HH682_03095 [Rosenbergiella sp. S61]|uniref:Secreted protein n=1 Tax=Rosenbergiella gaditana TaxID=2726987 RepID=A0ABS5STP0_9GAMM|nr:hypothetical protein [Rosenbergiella gaditana]MBT0723446.1 hypothetical protein [Rosenbergiella gaditana]